MRLTKKDRYGHFYTNNANCRNIWSKDGKKLEGEFIENQTLAIDGNAIDKLGQLEDIEDLLGIDLITLFKALKQGHIYIVKNSEIVMSCDYNLGLTGLTYDLFCKDINKWLLVKDYGKTWALTKEELEKHG